MPPLSYYTIGEDQGEDELPPAILPLTEEGGNAIRLLTLREPSSYEGDTLSLEMHLSTTSEEYIGLSYEWGQAEPDDPIILVNNRQVQIRKNLHDAIRQIFEHYSYYRKHHCGATAVDERVLEDHDESFPYFPLDRHRGPFVDTWSCRDWSEESLFEGVWLWEDGSEEDCYEKASFPWTNLGDSSFWAKHNPPRLWIDALCINHRRQQRENSAKLVLSWIGLPRDGSNDALRMVRILSMSCGKPSELGQKEGLTDSLIVSIASLCERTYWRRVWILQELFLAQKYMVMCGPESIASESFDEALARLARTPIPHDSIDRSAAKAIVASTWNKEAYSLVRWLRVILVGNFQATVPHDYIYALLSISSDAVLDMDKPDIDRAQIIVDYDKTVAEAYCQFLQSFEAGPSLMKHRLWLLKLALKMGLSREEGVALLDSEHSKRCEVTKGSKSDLDNWLFGFRYL
ncbi:hypothetical protein NEUTE1DRAFT_111439 [Neurospora tetrasperma FGSC 2508]|uniref:Heterokaryon incompatibility domain-containing protein n=1 Tax=Neurospora tetrasperma (strain FGSC 2508 / ATCC MYA-4615 / P0657) TaxID=510951 RepID=F8MP65_NEUT8|nr:uncharacterized protein NEUTE1DRAFT_111439 [Neurospora tetrasperma FGSC 2508]EGO57077.1 hypothetical protein NEUTE1DRAFT_111439 [Neurospora tetrasperma FGSC 2508]